MTRVLPVSVIVMMLAGATASAQSGVQTTSGEALQFLPEDFRSYLTFKSDDASVNAAVAYRDLGIGFGLAAGVTVKTTDGVTALVKDGTFRPGFKANVSTLHTSLFVAPPAVGAAQGFQIEDWVTVKVSYERLAHAVFNASSPFESQITKTTFDGLGLAGSYGLNIGGFVALGTTVGRRKTTNYESLDPVDISMERVFQSAEEGGPTRLVQSARSSAKEGTYVTGNVTEWRNEVFFYPGSDPRVGFGAYHNGVFAGENVLERTDLGATLALLKQGSPSTALAALVFELKDVLDSQNKGKRARDMFVLSVQVSLPLAPKLGW